MSTPKQEIEIDGVTYTLKETPTSGREIVVCDRGWIFVGHVADEQPDEGLRLVNASNLRKWKKNGFGGVITNPKEAGVELDPCGTVVALAVMSRHPIPADWNE